MFNWPIKRLVCYIFLAYYRSSLTRFSRPISSLPGVCLAKQKTCYIFLAYYSSSLTRFSLPISSRSCVFPPITGHTSCHLTLKTGSTLLSLHHIGMLSCRGRWLASAKNSSNGTRRYLWELGGGRDICESWVGGGGRDICESWVSGGGGAEIFLSSGWVVGGFGI